MASRENIKKNYLKKKRTELKCKENDYLFHLTEKSKRGKEVALKNFALTIRKR